MDAARGNSHACRTATTDEQVKALVDSSDNIQGFKISGISHMGEGPKDVINVDLYPSSPASHT